MPAKKLTEANCHPKYSCSKLLLVDATYVNFEHYVIISFFCEYGLNKV